MGSYRPVSVPENRASAVCSRRLRVAGPAARAGSVTNRFQLVSGALFGLGVEHTRDQAERSRSLLPRSCRVHDPQQANEAVDQNQRGRLPPAMFGIMPNADCNCCSAGFETSGGNRLCGRESLSREVPSIDLDLCDLSRRRPLAGCANKPSILAKPLTSARSFSTRPRDGDAECDLSLPVISDQTRMSERSAASAGTTRRQPDRRQPARH
jgi:hypothetical protein